MMVVLFLSLLAAPDFLDLPPRRRSGGDFIGRANPLVVCDPAATHITRAMLQCNINIALHKKPKECRRLAPIRQAPADRNQALPDGVATLAACWAMSRACSV